MVEFVLGSVASPAIGDSSRSALFPSVCAFHPFAGRVVEL